METKSYLTETKEERISRLQKRMLYDYNLNKWWHSFYELMGSSNYDAAQADKYRTSGYSPKQTVSILK